MPVDIPDTRVHVNSLPAQPFPRDWLVESVAPGEIHAHRSECVVAEIHLNQARATVLDTAYGRVLIKNDRLQSTQKDEWIYHEALVHPGLSAHPQPRSVLCIGGTTGAIAREILRHKTVEEVFVFWVDLEMINALDPYLPYAGRELTANSRIKGIYSVPPSQESLGGRKFDVIIADPPEPSESGAPDTNVYQHVVQAAAGILTEDGILAMAGGAVHPVVESLSTLPAAFTAARDCFRTVKLGIANVPSLGIPWGMLFCSQNPNAICVDAATVDGRLAQRQICDLRFYDGETHAGMFSLPKHVRLWLPEV
jgi:spermidine synthase